MTRKERKPGDYIELGVDHIDDGKFRERFEEQLRRAYHELEAYEKASGDLEGQVKLTLELKVSRASEQFFAIEDAFKIATPKIAHSSMARGGKGRLLYDPDSDSLNDRDQMQLMPTFDRFGNPQAPIDPATGEVVGDDDDSVAGQVGKAGGDAG